MLSTNTEALPVPAGSAVSATPKLIFLYRSAKALFTLLTADCQRKFGLHKMGEIYSLLSVA
jgi:hypothetical protein